MEPKKNPKYDVHRKRSLIFNFSLALSLLIVVSAFRIAVPYQDICTLPVGPPEFDEIIPDIPVTGRTKHEPLPLPTKQPVTRVINLANIKTAAVYSEFTDNPDVDQESIETVSFEGLVIPTEIADDTTTFIFVQHKPEPIGGYSQFYKTLHENMKYPPKAIRNETTGKVFVEFTVDKQGEVSHAKVLRGIGSGCDEEAIRVIRLTKWNPGKQRGKPVKVRMVLPVVFHLNR